MSIPFPFAVILSGLLAFIALGYEIVWSRFYNFATGGRAEAFGAMLGSFLFGLALGSWWSRRWQPAAAGTGTSPRLLLSRLVLISNLAAYAVIPLALALIARVPAFAALPLRTLPLVMVAGGFSGVLFPWLCHQAVPADRQSGARVSFLYLANIIGSGAGSLFTGFLLMDWLPLRHITALLLATALGLSLFLGGSSRAARWMDWTAWSVATLLVAAAPRLHAGLFERLFYRSADTSPAGFEQVVENRHGVITVDAERKVYGGGVYDGVIDTRLTRGSGLVRPYFISALHEHPRDVLVIGVSGGAWTQILAHHPAVEKITAVEINPGYLEIIRRYPQVASLLNNPKVSLVIDDGRRWLRRHPDRQFDVIVMNTTYHWREFASALLSREFLEIVRRHLKPGGLVMWNCTGSSRALKTGLEVFPHTLMVMNNCIGSMHPLKPDRERWRSVLSEYRIDGRPVFDLSTSEGARRLDEVVAFVDNRPNSPGGWRWKDRETMEQFFREAETVTDDNLGHEYQSSFYDLFGVRLLP